MSDLYVVSTGRNASKFVLKCIQSVKDQTLQPKSHIIIDDISDDDTRLYLERIKNIDENIEVIFNTERKYRLKNIYENSVNKNPDDIICIVDSDDWLACDDALEKIKKTYDENPKYEYVYSRLVLSHGPPGGSRPIPNKDWNPYDNQWITSHISTFRAKALQRIPVSNFLDWNGDWFQIATDHACILPMLYNLWRRDGDYSAVGFIDEALYVYQFLENENKSRFDTEGQERARFSIQCANFIKQRKYLEE